jgi:hypothetical protein
MPKYLIHITELSPSDVPLDVGSHDTVQYRPVTRGENDEFFGLVVPASSAKLATLKASILTAIGVAETA